MKVYAVHTSGKKLWYPTEDALHCKLIPRSDIAAISIDQNGATYPEGTFYLLRPDGKCKAGWHRVTDHLENAKNGQNLRVPEGQKATGTRESTQVGVEDYEEGI